jgi:hypothetical protein
MSEVDLPSSREEVTGHYTSVTDSVTSSPALPITAASWALKESFGSMGFEVPGTARETAHPLGVGMSPGRLLQPTPGVGLFERPEDRLD